jgi:hypothetical protein
MAWENRKIAQLLPWSAGPTNVRKENPKLQVKEIMIKELGPAVIGFRFTSSNCN